jgi:hypothetical protein
MPKLRKRAATDSSNDIGQERYELYKSAFTQITESIKAGYYLEAISIVESLISDRLESHLSLRLGRDFSFKTLGALIQGIKEHETDRTLRSVVLDDLDQWRAARNKAAHEMVKIEEGKQISWDERTKVNEVVAVQGLKLVRKIDQTVRKLRS